MGPSRDAGDGRGGGVCHPVPNDRPATWQGRRVPTPAHQVRDLVKNKERNVCM